MVDTPCADGRACGALEGLGGTVAWPPRRPFVVAVGRIPSSHSALHDIRYRTRVALRAGTEPISHRLT